MPAQRTKRFNDAPMMSMKQALKFLAMPGARMMLMHDNRALDGKSYFIVPGGKIDCITAKAIMDRWDVIEQEDGLFSGHSQTWQFIR